MVDLSEDFEIPTETALRVRASSHTYRSGAARCSNRRRQSNLRRRIYDGGDQSESCSRDPIGFADGVHLYCNSFLLSDTDPSGNSVVGDYLKRTQCYKEGQKLTQACLARCVLLPPILSVNCFPQCPRIGSLHFMVCMLSLPLNPATQCKVSPTYP